MKKFCFLLSIFYFLLLFAPFLAYAHIGPGAEMPSIFPTGFWAGEGTGGFVPCAQTDYENVREKCTFNELIHSFLHIISFGMTIALFVAAPILFAWGGIMIMISGGDPGKFGQGKKILTGTLIGVLIILSSFLILKTFVDILGLGGGLQELFN